ncbi:LiaF transmembrane domain-containing protein [Pseudoduganella violacea]|uniref:LiaF transmembrane domain-containing protein n=1 Tax=Pseudoduganella violacea TaxID=1715466 RepID=A0A7W5FT04_9BURK|nr:DUF5668 domain-containing protein [Pseudoduganella violacea]MBB3118339.1 hypothetical protein [Pseudoduganella violacea]
MNSSIRVARKQLVWGLLIIGAGVLFWLEDGDFKKVTQFWHYWPLVIAAFGFSQLVPPTTARMFIDGVCEILFAFWIFACFEHLWGMSFSNSWPFMVIMGGVSLALQPILGKYIESKKGE